mgnify:CR=1 FL=1
MATTFTETTLSSTYKDDFRDSDNYHRILFNTGVGLQARELTQLQTMLQKQIERFGNNVFKEGSVVKPGGANVNPQYEFIKLDETDPSHVMPTDVTTLVGKTVTGQTSSIVATIIEAVAAAGSDPATLYVKYTNTSSAQSSTDIITQRMTSNEVMDVSDGTDLKVKPSTIADPSTGTGTQVTLRSGIYYARGNFVFTQDQSKIISKYTDTPTTDIGFKAVEEVVTASDNNALYDNQGSVPNVSAPGADRYRITLTIAERSDLGVNENFIHVATIVKGAIYEAIETEQAYNIPNQLIATRIKENSGDYVVKPFNARFELDSENTHLLLKVSDGVVVVDGYRAARAYPSTIRIAKPNTTTVINNEPTSAVLGNNVLVDVSVGGSATTNGIPNFNEMEEMDLRDAVTNGGNSIGTARVKAITKSGTDLKMHLTDIQLDAGRAFRNVKSIGTSTSNYFDIKLENSKAVLKEPTNDFSFFVLPKARPQSITDLIYTAQRKFTGKSANSSGVITLQGLSGGEVYTQTDEFVFAKADSDVAITSPTISLSGGGTGGTVDFGTGGPVATIASSSNIEYTSFISKTITSPKTKTLTTFNLTNTVESDGSGFKFINLKRADIFEIDEVVSAADSNESYISRFNLDNGQRPSRYEPGRLLLRDGQSAPAGNIFVKYKFFEPSASGDYFSVNSYTGQVDYDKIPTFKTNQGTTVNLRSVIDFRSVADSAGNFNTAGATMIELPQNNSTITADVTYNLGVAAKLSIDKSSNLVFLGGAPSFSPQFPDRQPETLPLYNIVLNPATLNDSDVSLSKFNFKRFTMKDIGALEKRIDRLEDFTTLSLLELDTKNMKVLDSAGNDRTKSGFLVDDFKDHSFSQLTPSNEYRASIDLQRRQMRSIVNEDQIRMIYDSASSINTIKRGDNVYPVYDEELYINQNTASQAIKINPFAVTIYNGVINLSPASDEWRDVERLPDKIIPGGSVVSRRPAYLFNNHIYDWCGTTTDQALNRVVTNEAILTLVEDRVIESVLSHFMRARKVYFKASGLRPNTRVFTFLDGNNISNLTNGTGGEGGFQFYSDTDSDFGNTLKNVTVHPDGASTLVTDGDGIVSGSFIVPNNDNIKIRTGTRQFKILDISVDKEENAAAISTTAYTASGFIDTKEAEYTSTRIIYRPYFSYYGDVSDNSGGPDRAGIVYQIGDGNWNPKGYGKYSDGFVDRSDTMPPMTGIGAVDGIPELDGVYSGPGSPQNFQPSDTFDPSYVDCGVPSSNENNDNPFSDGNTDGDWSPE